MNHVDFWGETILCIGIINAKAMKQEARSKSQSLTIVENILLIILKNTFFFNTKPRKFTFTLTVFVSGKVLKLYEF